MSFTLGRSLYAGFLAASFKIEAIGSVVGDGVLVEFCLFCWDFDSSLSDAQPEMSETRKKLRTTEHKCFDIYLKTCGREVIKVQSSSYETKQS